MQRACSFLEEHIGALLFLLLLIKANSFVPRLPSISSKNIAKLVQNAYTAVALCRVLRVAEEDTLAPLPATLPGPRALRRALLLPPLCLLLLCRSFPASWRTFSINDLDLIPPPMQIGMGTESSQGSVAERHSKPRTELNLKR